MNYAQARISKVEALELLVLGVFIYAASDKLWHSLRFKAALLRVDYLPPAWVAYISVAIPIVELGIVALCLVRHTKRIGWIFAGSLLIIFTMHLVFLWVSKDAATCGCGGLFDELSMPFHIGINIALIISTMAVLWKAK